MINTLYRTPPAPTHSYANRLLIARDWTVETRPQWRERLRQLYVDGIYELPHHAAEALATTLEAYPVASRERQREIALESVRVPIAPVEEIVVEEPIVAPPAVVEPAPRDPLLTCVKVAEVAGVKLGTVYAWSKRGLLPPPEKKWHRPVWRLSTIVAWLEATGRAEVDVPESPVRPRVVAQCAPRAAESVPALPKRRQKPVRLADHYYRW